jgi:transposase InsO family protein
MPWQEVTAMSQRQEFVSLASNEDANIRLLCRRFGISPTTAYKWLRRFERDGPAGLAELSRRPEHSPARTTPEVEELLTTLRRRHPAWGARKLRARLTHLGHTGLPATSTITDILRRHGLIAPEDSQQRRPFVRFEHQSPNDLWQMDFKGDFALPQGRCHTLTVLDDHSRFALALQACRNQTRTTVQACLTAAFRRYGLPRRMLTDNGSPWGTCHRGARFTRLSAWLIRYGIAISHGRPYHPQTQGKDERFNRTLQTEVLRGRTFRDHREVQDHLDPWRDVYNLERPHEALGLATPASRYQPSPRPFPETLPPIEYGPDDQVRHADYQGYVSYQHRKIFVSEAFAHQPLAFRPTATDGLLGVFFCQQQVDILDLRNHTDP